MGRFPEIDFVLPGTATGKTENGTISEDEWGRYALIKGVLPESTADSPYGQALSAFENLDRELGSGGRSAE